MVNLQMKQTMSSQKPRASTAEAWASFSGAVTESRHTYKYCTRNDQLINTSEKGARRHQVQTRGEETRGGDEERRRNDERREDKRGMEKDKYILELSYSI